MKKRLIAEYTDVSGVRWSLKSAFVGANQPGCCGRLVLSLHSSVTGYRPLYVNDPRIRDTGLYLYFSRDSIFEAEEREALSILAEMGWRKLVMVDLENREGVAVFKKDNPHNKWSYANDHYINNDRVCLYTKAILESLEDATAKLALGLFYGMCDVFTAFDSDKPWPRVSEIIQASRMAVS